MYLHTAGIPIFASVSVGVSMSGCVYECICVCVCLGVSFCVIVVRSEATFCRDDGTITNKCE